MVMLVSNELLKVRPVCLSRLYLHRAHAALDRGDTIAAGCLLREAVFRYLAALCEYHNCLPQKKQDRTPSIMLRALRKSKQFDSCGFQWVKDSIQIGNKLAHCRPVRGSLVECCIGLLHCLLDNSPELIFPTREGGAV